MLVSVGKEIVIHSLRNHCIVHTQRGNFGIIENTRVIQLVTVAKESKRLLEPRLNLSCLGYYCWAVLLCYSNYTTAQGIDV